MTPGFATRAIHGPETYRADDHDAVVEAIYMNTAFRFPSADEAVERFQHPKDAFVYSRYGNPTVRDFEERMASLEGGADAVAFASGTAAFLGALLTTATTGEHVLLQQYCYGGTYYLTTKLGPAFGIAATLVDPADLAACERALTPKTRALHIETPANPVTAIVDLRATADWAHAHGLKLVVDSTFASPALSRPLEHGADIVWHSCTKYIGGHGDVMGGVATVAAQDDAELMWQKWMHSLGTNLSPFNAFLLVRGLKTLALRMERHCQNAQGLAEWLEADPRVEQVRYPGLASHPGRALAARQMSGYGAMLAVDVRGGREAAFRFHDRVQVLTRSTSLGDTHSLISHPASTSHRQYTEAERLAFGVSQGTLRLSVGIEDLADLIADCDQALG